MWGEKFLTNMDKENIEQAAEAVLKKSGYQVDGNGYDSYVDISALATKMGFRVGVTKKLDFLEDGFISISADGKDRAIGVNDYRSVEEKRFAVAHELAHYYLHLKDESPGSAIMHRENREEKDSAENEADYFAACILMPENSFKREWNILKSRGLDNASIISCLQDLFRTPIMSVARRIEEVCE